MQDSLATQQSGRELCLALARVIVPLVGLDALVGDDIEDIALRAQVLCRRWHELVDDLAEDIDVASGVLSDAEDKLVCGVLVLRARD
jgi:hypothetical protein